MSTRRSRARHVEGVSRRVGAVLVVIAVAALPPVVAADPPGAQTPTGDLDGARASVESLRRDRSEVRAQLAAMQSQRTEAFNRWTLYQLAAEAARTEEAGAVMRAERARLDAIEALERTVEYATEAFMNPPATQSLAVLSIGDAESASRAHDLLTIVADEERSVVGELIEARRTEDERAAQARRRGEEARASEAASREELRRLEDVLEQQQALSADVERRYDAALAEVEALEAVDRAAAARLAAEERELAEQSRTAVAGASATKPAAPSAAARTRSGGGTTPTTTAPKATTPTTAAPRPPSAPPPGLATWQDVTKVGGIWVHRSIAGRVQSLLDAAAAAGFRFSGGGFRDPAEQIRFRRAHCGPTDYDIYQRPASECTPPTAPPGRSMHERGLAIDFTVNGRVISSRSDAAFQWLAANAASYGLYNLPSEPWHWSTNGN